MLHKRSQALNMGDTCAAKLDYTKSLYVSCGVEGPK